MGQKGEEILGNGNTSYIFITQFFEKLQYESGVEFMGAQEVGVARFRQNRNHLVSGKGDLTGKMAMLTEFFRHIPTKKSELLLQI